MSDTGENEFMKIFLNLRNSSDGPQCGREAAAITAALILVEGRLAELCDAQGSPPSPNEGATS